jgi:hypothetical protein
MNARPEAPAVPVPADRSLPRGLTAICLALWLLPLGFRIAALPLAFGLAQLVGHGQWTLLPAGRWFLAFATLSLGLTPFVPFPGVHLAALTATYLLWGGYWHLLATLSLPSGAWHSLHRAVAGSGTVLALTGLANRLGLSFFWWWGGGVKEPWLILDLSDRYRVASGIGMNPNILAAFLILTWPVTLVQALRHSGRRRWLWLGATLVQWITLLLTQSRGAVLALAVVGLTWAWRRREVRRPLLALVTALGLLASPVWLPLGARLATLADAGQSSNLVRQSLWRSGTAMIADWPVTGVGVAAFPLAYPPYRQADDIYNSDHLHDWYLQTVVESGIPAAGLFFAGVWLVIRQARRGHHPAAEATLGFAVFGLGDYLFHDPRILMVIWTIWALGVQTGYDGGESDAAPAT